MTQEEWRKRFSEQLVNNMKKRGLNQSHLAERSGLSVSRISDYVNMRATPSVHAVINIAYALDTSIRELVDFDKRICT